MKLTPDVLIVDDEPDMCWVLTKVLEPGGLRTATATTAAEALRILERVPVVLVLLDAKLPDANPETLCAKIKAIRSETKIVLISGYFFDDDPLVLDLAERQIIAGFVGKPFEAKEVINKVQKVLQETGVAQAREGAQGGKPDGRIREEL